jgi:hypothetical protein
MAQAAGVRSAPATANAKSRAADAPESTATAADTPDAPGVGAVQAAIAAQMPTARACIARQVDASHANVVFGSNGRALSVVVDGPILNGRVEACVQAAFMKANVGPFRRTRYSVGVKIRP